MEEELTVPELLQGLLRREYFDHRAQLLQLLVNQFAAENEAEEMANSQLVVSSPENSKPDSGTTLSTTEIPKKSMIAPKISEGIFQQVLRVILEFASSEKLGTEIVNLSLAVLVNATIKHQYAVYLLENIDNTNQSDNNVISKKFHGLIQKYLSYNPQIETEEMSSPDFVWESFDHFQYVGSILCNLCQHESGRKLVLHTATNYMSSFPPQVCSVIVCLFLF